MPTRYRADLADVAWAKEYEYGKMPLAAETNALNNSIAGHLRGQWGLVTGGIDLPNPTYDWQPFYGLGVMNRNMLFPIQGRERLEGRVSQTLLCHDSSRLWLEQMIGLAFNGKNADDASYVASVASYTPRTAGSGSAVTATTFTVTGANFATYTPDSSNIVTHPTTHIVICSDQTAGATAQNPDRTQDTWAYVGEQYSSTAGFSVWKNQKRSEAGWNGVRPTGGATQKYSIHGIGQQASSTGASNANNVLNITADANQDKLVIIRPTLVQPSFTLGARFRADDGSEFLTNYSGCKVSRAVFNFEEGAPVNFGADFIARDMSHNIGEHDVTGNAIETLKYKAEGATAVTATNYAETTLPPNYMKDIRVTEQPYFYSSVKLTFQGTPIARFRRFTITIDNGLEPRYYITQNDAASPRDNRQILHEIIEGRRGISFGGSLDLDDDGTTNYPLSGASPTDAMFLRYLLNQGMTGSDIRDINTIAGIGIEVELRQNNDFTGSSNNNVHNVMKFMLPSNGNATTGSASEVGMIIRSAPHNIPAPPNIHVPVDIDGMCSSMHIEIMDGVNVSD